MNFILAVVEELKDYLVELVVLLIVGTAITIGTVIHLMLKHYFNLARKKLDDDRDK